MGGSSSKFDDASANNKVNKALAVQLQELRGAVHVLRLALQEDYQHLEKFRTTFYDSRYNSNPVKNNKNATDNVPKSEEEIIKSLHGCKSQGEYLTACRKLEGNDNVVDSEEWIQKTAKFFELYQQLDDMKFLQQMFCVAAGFGLFTYAYDIFELGVRRLQIKNKNKKARSEDEFDINAKGPSFPHPDSAEQQTLRPGDDSTWSPLQLAIASLNQSLFMMINNDSKNSDSRTTTASTLYREAKVELGVCDISPDFRLESGVSSSPLESLYVSTKRKVADFVEFLLSEGADVNSLRTLTTQDKQAVVRAAKLDTGTPEYTLKKDPVFFQYHPLQLAVGNVVSQRARVDAEKTPNYLIANELVVAELVANSESCIIDPIVIDSETSSISSPLLAVTRCYLPSPARFQIAELLIARGAEKDFHSQYFGGLTPVTQALVMMDLDMVKLLVANGVNLKAEKKRIEAQIASMQDKGKQEQFAELFEGKL